MNQPVSTPSRLDVGGRQFRRQDDGGFVVSIDHLASVDLSRVQPGIKINVDYRKMNGHVHLKLGPVRRILTQANGNSLVSASIMQCSACWTHSLDYAKFHVIALELIVPVQGSVGCLRVEGIGPVGPSFAVLYELEVFSMNFQQMEHAVEAIMMPILKPLFAYRDKLDADTMALFGV